MKKHQWIIYGMLNEKLISLRNSVPTCPLLSHIRVVHGWKNKPWMTAGKPATTDFFAVIGLMAPLLQNVGSTKFAFHCAAQSSHLPKQTGIGAFAAKTGATISYTKNHSFSYFFLKWNHFIKKYISRYLKINLPFETEIVGSGEQYCQLALILKIN